MNWMVLPNQVCLIVKLYNNRPGLLPDSNDIVNVLHLLYVSCPGSVIKERNQIFFAISFFAGRLVLSKFVGLNNLVSIT